MNRVSFSNDSGECLTMSQKRNTNICYCKIEVEQMVLSATNFNGIEISFLNGIYAFCIVQQQNDQYLLLKPLNHNMSNHGIFKVFIKKLPGYSKNDKIISGGEIYIYDNIIKLWNLKSGGFSVDTDFDERSEKFNIRVLNLPAHLFVKIKYVPHVFPEHNSRGSVEVHK